MSRHLSDLHPIVEDAARDALSICKSKGYDVLITCTMRTNGEQNSLYAKGRTTPGAIVTNAKAGQSYHNPCLQGKSVALDICPLVNGKCAWDRHDLFKEIASIFKSVGFEWGGDFKTFVDNPHLQMTFGYTVHQLSSGEYDGVIINRYTKHWADNSHAYLLENWLDSLEKRFDDTITRGEVFSLLERILKQWED